jgi:PTH1 family peptidyl-tRNA hydrolase
MSKEDRAKAEDAIDDAVSAACLMLNGRVDQAMNDYNAKKQE